MKFLDARTAVILGALASATSLIFIGLAFYAMQDVGTDNAERSDSFSKEASAAFEQRHHGQAIELYKAALQESKKAGNDLQTSRVLNDLADVYICQKDYHKGEECLNAALLLGEQHSKKDGMDGRSVASLLEREKGATRAKLAEVLEAENRPEEALQAYNTALEELTSTAGDVEVKDKALKNQLALLRKLGRDQTASATDNQEQLSISSTDWNKIFCQANALTRQGKMLEASKQFALAKLLAKKKHDAAGLAVCTRGGAICLLALGHYIEAEEELRDSLTVLASNHNYQANILLLLAFCLRQEGKAKEALALMKQALRLKTARPFDESLSQLDFYYFFSHQPQKSLELNEWMFTTGKETGLLRPPELAEVYGHLADSLFGVNRLREAEAMFVKTLAVEDKETHPDENRYVHSMLQLLHLDDIQGKDEDATRICNKLIEHIKVMKYPTILTYRDAYRYIAIHFDWKHDFDSAIPWAERRVKAMQAEPATDPALPEALESLRLCREHKKIL
jgi:tetratricopeptide (TPR) repeat protein